MSKQISDKDMKLYYKLLESKTPEQLETIEGWVNHFRQQNNNKVSSIVFKVTYDTDLSISYLNYKGKEVKSDNLTLEYKDYQPRSVLDNLSKKKGQRKNPNYIGNEIMEQFHKTLLGRILGPLKGLKYNSYEITLSFENFNFFGSSYIIGEIINHFETEIGVMTMNRKNGKNAEVELMSLKDPIKYKITYYSKPEKNLQL